MAHIRIIEPHEAEGALREAYEAMKTRPLPSVYRAPHGGPAGIQRAHSLDVELMQVTFAATGTMHAGAGLSWADRELIAARASRVNQCFY
jgi:alkylhydroperoxidase family enzyme